MQGTFGKCRYQIFLCLQHALCSSACSHIPWIEHEEDWDDQGDGFQAALLATQKKEDSQQRHAILDWTGGRQKRQLNEGLL